MTDSPRIATDDFVQGIVGGDRAVLGQAISLVESDHPSHRQQAEALVSALMQHTGKAHRIGVTGVPGVGKSTLIETLGNLIIDAGHRVAVLAIDPSSELSGGSILGDKTRMNTLSVHPKAFVRPSPNAGTPGGVHRKTRETMILCEAAGYDIILVETVGVGQSETLVSNMVDSMLVLMLPGAGDELQGIKRGIIEIADLLVINKADGDNLQRAATARSQLRSALALVPSRASHWKRQVATCSGLHGEGVADIWKLLQSHLEALVDSGALQTQRQDQRVRWMWDMVTGGLLDALKRDEAVRQVAATLESEVRLGQTGATHAARRILACYLASS